MGNRRVYHEHEWSVKVFLKHAKQNSKKSLPILEGILPHLKSILTTILKSVKEAQFPGKCWVEHEHVQCGAMLLIL